MLIGCPPGQIIIISCFYAPFLWSNTRILASTKHQLFYSFKHLAFWLRRSVACAVVCESAPSQFNIYLTSRSMVHKLRHFLVVSKMITLLLYEHLTWTEFSFLFHKRSYSVHVFLLAFPPLKASDSMSLAISAWLYCCQLWVNQSLDQLNKYIKSIPSYMAALISSWSSCYGNTRWVLVC